MRKMLLTTELVVETPTALAPSLVWSPRRQPIPATRAPKTNPLINPAITSCTLIALVSCCHRAAVGNPRMSMTRNPPATPSKSA